MRPRLRFLALLLAALLGSSAMAQQPPAAPQAKLQKAAIDVLVGSWHGPVAGGAGALTFVVKFKVDDKGDLQGSLTVPEQGGTALAMSAIQFVDNKLTFHIGVVPGEFTASYVNGTLDGLWRQGEPLNPPEGCAGRSQEGRLCRAGIRAEAKCRLVSFAGRDLERQPAGGWTPRPDYPSHCAAFRDG
ncbi:MAG: hypothetical protein WDM77_22270 [Steroidobacteraceae bacterium]